MPARDVSAQLIDQLAIIAGPDCCIALIRERPWASITFSGTRHSFVIDCTKSGADHKGKVTTQLSEQEFSLTGHFVADVLIREPKASEPDNGVRLEVLTIIDPVVPKPG